MIGRIYHGPGDWFSTRFSSRDRRSFGFWTFVLSVVGTIVLQVLGVRDAIWFLWLAVLSVFALYPNFSSETPVEIEGDEVEVNHADKVEGEEVTVE